MSEQELWRKEFFQEWKEFCALHKLPPFIQNRMWPTLCVASSDYEFLERKYKEWAASPYRNAVYYAQHALEDMALWREFRQRNGKLLTFRQWLEDVHYKRFHLRNIRNFGKVSEKRLKAAVDRHIMNLTTEYAYA